MKIVKCDLCGKEIEKPCTLQILLANVLLGTFTMDLCDDCARQVEKNLVNQAKRRSNCGQIES